MLARKTRFLSAVIGVIILTGVISIFPGIQPAFSQDEYIATVIAIRGSATASSVNGDIRNLEKNSKIFLTDHIQTNDKTKIKIRFLDQTIVNLGQNASLNIAQFEWNQENQKGSLQMDVQEGAFRILGGFITKKSPENFSMNSPVATIGIRGSSFAGRASQNSLDVVFLSGVGIFVTNSKDIIDLSTPGTGTEVRGAQAPSAPLIWSSEKFEALSLEYLIPEGDSAQQINLNQQNFITNQVRGEQTSGSSIQGTILNQSENRGSVNVSIGSGSKSNTGSVIIKDSTSEGLIVNQSQNTSSVNVSSGDNNTANLGSTSLLESNVQGTVFNQSDNTGSTNVSEGKDNQGNQGSLVIE